MARVGELGLPAVPSEHYGDAAWHPDAAVEGGNCRHHQGGWRDRRHVGRAARGHLSESAAARQHDRAHARQPDQRSLRRNGLEGCVRRPRTGCALVPAAQKEEAVMTYVTQFKKPAYASPPIEAALQSQTETRLLSLDEM